VDCLTTKDFTCGQGTSCNAPGSVCGKPMMILADGGLTCQPGADGGGCFTVPVTVNCCDEASGFKNDTCRVDSSGVPRCFGGGTPSCPYGYTGQPGCCIGAGASCQFSSQCCSGMPCVPDDAGVPRCTVPQCISLGASCTPGGTGASACCTGDCLAVSELSYACQMPSPVPDAGTDAGTGCSLNGAGCSTGTQCCSGTCSGGVCTTITCQPQGGACSANADCCSGYQCTINPGSTTGTCQVGQTCGSAGQSCSPSNLCCGEGSTLKCTDSSDIPCTGSTACTCKYIVGKIQPTWP